MSGSKTKYYVSSSTFPMFDDSSRVNQYAAAMLDYTANSPIEHSEYIKSFYNTSRLRNYRGYLNWCEKSGFNDTFGRVNANFYGDAKLDNNQVGNAIKHLFNLGENDTFGVYNSKLSFFSEDFYIKYLATQQGLADKFHADGDLYYTISYPTDTTIRATLEDGTYIEGELPTGSLNTRFIEISYSILREIQEEYYPPEEELPEEPTEPDAPEDPDSGEITDPENPEGEEGGEVTPDPEPEPPKPIIITKYVAEYGYYHYKEGSGNIVLDALIRNNNTPVSKSFFPPIPLRTNTSWFSGNKASKINEALKYLEIRNTNSDRETGYEQLKTACSKMEKGSINDIDYITILLGVHLNSDNNSDQRYLFEFFYNLYFNYALKSARPDPSVARSLYSGSNYFNSFADYALKGFSDSGYTDGYFTKFNLKCAASNLNLTYSWGHADYFESNGQFKPEAKIGDYGILGGSFTYNYSVAYQVHATDDEGSYLYSYIDTNGDGETDTAVPVYETRYKHYSVPYTLTLFCHQTSQNRFRFTLFTSLSLTNLVYHGKTINTSSWDAINAAASKKDTFIDFIDDVDKSNQDGSWLTRILISLGLIPTTSKSTGISLKYVDVTGEIDTPFIVPLEQNTFYEIGVTNQANIAPCSMFLIYNCWQKVKQKWYQRGIFKWVALAVAVVVCIFAPYLAPVIGTAAATAVAVAAYVAAIVIGVSIIIDVLTKVISAIFGDRIGGIVGGLLKSVYNFVCTWLANFFGYWTPIGIGIMIGMSVNNADAAMQNGVSFGKALAQGFGKTAVSMAAYEVGAGVGDKLGTIVYVGLESLGHTYLETGSFTTSLKQAGINAAVAAVTMGALEGSNQLFGTTFSTGIGSSLSNSGAYTGEITKDVVTNAIETALTQSASTILKNPNTYMNLISAGIQEYYQHKLKNIRNDYQEFNNNLQATQDALDVLNACMGSTVTAEFVAMMQSNLGRMLDINPDTYLTMTPDQFLSIALASGTEMIKQTLGCATSFVDTKLTMEGYTPSTLYYTQIDPTLLWDVT